MAIGVCVGVRVCRSDSVHLWRWGGGRGVGVEFRDKVWRLWRDRSLKLCCTWMSAHVVCKRTKCGMEGLNTSMVTPGAYVTHYHMLVQTFDLMVQILNG